MMSLGMSGFRQWLGNRSDDEENVDDGNSSSKRHNETVAIHAAEVRTDRRACHQARSECRRHLHSIYICHTYSQSIEPLINVHDILG